MQKPSVSVIIPVYNRLDLVKNAIDSVLSQDFKDFELIVVDDGSTDNTFNVLQSYKEKIIIIKLQENKGVSAARNIGIDQSLGEFIALLDSDDIWLQGKLSNQMNFFNSNKDALICQTDEIWIRNGERVNPKKRHKKLSGMIFEQSLNLCLVSPSAVMFKRNLFYESGRFDEKLLACEDYDLWLRITYKYPVYLIEKPLIVKYGGHTDQLSKEPGLDKYRIYALEKIINSSLLSSSQYEAALKVLKEKCIIYSNGCKKRNRYEEASFMIEKSQVQVI